MREIVGNVTVETSVKFGETIEWATADERLQKLSALSHHVIVTVKKNHDVAKASLVGRRRAAPATARKRRAKEEGIDIAKISKTAEPATAEEIDGLLNQDWR